MKSEYFFFFSFFLFLFVSILFFNFFNKRITKLEVYVPEIVIYTDNEKINFFRENQIRNKIKMMIIFIFFILIIFFAKKIKDKIFSRCSEQASRLVRD